MLLAVRHQRARVWSLYAILMLIAGIAFAPGGDGLTRFAGILFIAGGLLMGLGSEINHRRRRNASS